MICQGSPTSPFEGAVAVACACACEATRRARPAASWPPAHTRPERAKQINTCELCGGPILRYLLVVFALACIDHAIQLVLCAARRALVRQTVARLHAASLVLAAPGDDVDHVVELVLRAARRALIRHAKLWLPDASIVLAALGDDVDHAVELVLCAARRALTGQAVARLLEAFIVPAFPGFEVDHPAQLVLCAAQRDVAAWQAEARLLAAFLVSAYVVRTRHCVRQSATYFVTFASGA